MGAMLLLVLENCRDKETSLQVVCAVLEAVIGTARERRVMVFMGGLVGGGVGAPRALYLGT